MNEEQQFKLQAFLDGELPEREAREVQAWTQCDAEAAALLAELRNTRQAVSKSETFVRVPESREFYWSKIERAIQMEPAQTRVASVSILFQLRRLVLPVGALSALVIVGLFAYSRMETAAAPDDSDAPVVEAMADSDATTYRDKADNTTLVWFSVPADSRNILK
ncbi:MAG TPA: hypothetical protein VMB22_09275 [Verrucomicrobiae bacterium]|nr:hypothetical protein [Verrucomicrobiae bacterium]